MTRSYDVGSYPQPNTPVSTGPSIVIENYDQQQAAVSGSSPLQAGGERLSTSLSGIFNYNPGLGQRNSNSQRQDLFDSSLTQPFIIKEFMSPVLGRIEKTRVNSWIYSDVLQGPNWKQFVHPWPPNRPTLTPAGFDPAGGHFIQLTLINKATPYNGGRKCV
jgi:hypothetical protein